MYDLTVICTGLQKHVLYKLLINVRIKRKEPFSQRRKDAVDTTDINPGIFWPTVQNAYNHHNGINKDGTHRIKEKVIEEPLYLVLTGNGQSPSCLGVRDGRAHRRASRQATPPAALRRTSSGSKSVPVSWQQGRGLRRTTRAPLCCLCCH